MSQFNSTIMGNNFDVYLRQQRKSKLTYSHPKVSTMTMPMLIENKLEHVD